MSAVLFSSLTVPLVSAAAVPVATWKVSSLWAFTGYVTSSIASPNSTGAKDWSVTGSCNITGGKIITLSSGRCTVNLIVGAKGKFAAKKFSKRFQVKTKIINGRKIYPGADLTKANLVGADLTGANLVDANLAEARLDSAKLSGADLTRANLDSASLGNANLTGATLNGAYLHGANLTRANLARADLLGAWLHTTNLNEANLLGARFVVKTWILVLLHGTTMPDGSIHD